MGILNVTPDSFYDGGKYRRTDRAIRRGSAMVEEGAAVLDVGGESTRPGSAPVPLDEELVRVVPVVRGLVRRFPEIPVSVDTQKAEVARRALAEGARIVNNVSAFRSDEKNFERVLQEFKPQVILMHMSGTPRTMQKHPRYDNVVAEVKRFLSSRIRWAAGLGVVKKNIWIDPGIGFGKTLQHNLSLLKNLRGFLSLGCPVAVGVSRKSFIGKALGGVRGPLPAEERLEGSLAAACWAQMNGAALLRVHDVAATARAMRLLESISASPVLSR